MNAIDNNQLELWNKLNESNTLPEIQNYIKEYNADNRFKLIINKAGLLYGDKSLDITEPIIKALNDRYNAAGQKATVPVDTTAKK